jgi:hypothetical protein
VPWEARTGTFAVPATHQDSWHVKYNSRIFFSKYSTGTVRYLFYYRLQLAAALREKEAKIVLGFVRQNTFAQMPSTLK